MSTHTSTGPNMTDTAAKARVAKLSTVLPRLSHPPFMWSADRRDCVRFLTLREKERSRSALYGKTVLILAVLNSMKLGISRIAAAVRK